MSHFSGSMTPSTSIPAHIMELSPASERGVSLYNPVTLWQLPKSVSSRTKLVPNLQSVPNFSDGIPLTALLFLNECLHYGKTGGPTAQSVIPVWGYSCERFASGRHSYVLESLKQSTVFQFGTKCCTALRSLFVGAGNKFKLVKYTSCLRFSRIHISYSLPVLQ